MNPFARRHPIGFFILVFALLLIACVARGQQPVCPWPKVTATKWTVQALPRGFREDAVLMWTCATPTGYRDAAFVFKYTDAVPWVRAVTAGTFKTADADAACARSCTLQYEDNLVAAIDAIKAPYLSHAQVAKAGTATTRPVYNVKPDGTLGELMVNVRVAVDAPCWIGGRIPGTSYYSVYGQPNAFTPFPDDKIGTGYAQCTVTLPLGAN